MKVQVEVESPLAPLVAMLEHHFDGDVWTAGAAKKEKTLAEVRLRVPLLLFTECSLNVP